MFESVDARTDGRQLDSHTINHKGNNLENIHERVMVLVHDTCLNVLYKCLDFR